MLPTIVRTQGSSASLNNTGLVPAAAATVATPESADKAAVKAVSLSPSTEVQVITPDATAVSSTPGTCPELTKELIASFALNGTIMLTVCDWRIFETFGEARGGVAGEGEVGGRGWGDQLPSSPSCSPTDTGGGSCEVRDPLPAPSELTVLPPIAPPLAAIYSPPGKNWMKHLNNLGIKYFIVGATDKKTAEFLSGQVGGGHRGGTSHALANWARLFLVQAEEGSLPLCPSE